MRSIIYISLLFLLLSCQSEQDPKEVFFRANVEKQNKAIVSDESLISNEGFGVMCYLKINGLFDQTTDTPNLCHNLKVTKVNGVWTNSRKIFWPLYPSDKVSFVAYAPYVDEEKGMRLSSNTRVGYPLMNYTANNTDITKQVDICYSLPVLNRTSFDGLVDFRFRHALTKIGFSSKALSQNDVAAGLKVKSVKLTNIIRKGNILLSETPYWQPSNLVEDTCSYVLSIANGGLKNTVLNTNNMQINNNDYYLMLIPQILSPQTKLEIVLSDANEREVKTIYYELSSLGVKRLNMGQNLNMLINVSAGNTYVTISASKDWDNEYDLGNIIG